MAVFYDENGQLFKMSLMLGSISLQARFPVHFSVESHILIFIPSTKSRLGLSFSRSLQLKRNSPCGNKIRDGLLFTPVFLSDQRDAQGRKEVFTKKALGTMRGNVWMEPLSSLGNKKGA